MSSRRRLAFALPRPVAARAVSAAAVVPAHALPPAPPLILIAVLVFLSIVSSLSASHVATAGDIADATPPLPPPCRRGAGPPPRRCCSECRTIQPPRSSVCIGHGLRVRKPSHSGQRTCANLNVSPISRPPELVGGARLCTADLAPLLPSAQNVRRHTAVRTSRTRNCSTQ